MRVLHILIIIMDVIWPEKSSTILRDTVVSSDRLPYSPMKMIAAFSDARELCALSMVSKRSRKMTRNQWGKRRDQTMTRKEMEHIWERMRNYPGFNLTFGEFPIIDASARHAIDHLISQIDGRANLICMAAFPFYHSFPVIEARTLLRILHSYEQRHVSVHPPHRFERYRCNISDDKMQLFDEYISLFRELKKMGEHINKRGDCGHPVKSAGIRWMREMEIIGAKIGYPNMEFYRERDLMHKVDDELLSRLFRILLLEWSGAIDVDDIVQRLKDFQLKLRDPHARH